MIEIRKIRKNEIPCAIELVKSGLKERLGSLVIVDFSDINSFETTYLSDGSNFYVALDGDRLIGTCGLVPLRDTTYKLARLSVHKDYRKQGIGRRLMEKATEYVESLGGQRVYLTVNKTWQRTIDMYKDMGYQIIEESEIEFHMIRKI